MDEHPIKEAVRLVNDGYKVLRVNNTKYFWHSVIVHEQSGVIRETTQKVTKLMTNLEKTHANRSR